jgi:hypothetical protein
MTTIFATTTADDEADAKAAEEAEAAAKLASAIKPSAVAASAAHKPLRGAANKKK